MEGVGQFNQDDQANQPSADFDFSGKNGGFNERGLSQEDWNLLSRRKRRINSILISLGVLIAVGLGLFQIYYNISHPFDALLQGSTAIDLATDQQTAVANEALKNKDTDGDGLSDYDELNIYQTSPYLTDSDSDGLNDKQEIDSGTNPNCPAGQTCAGSLASSASDVSTAGVPTLSSQPPAGGTLQITAQTIRTVLKQNGVSDEELSAITDEELMALYNEALVSNPELAAAISQSGTGVATVAAGQTAAAPQTENIDLSSFNVKTVDDLRNLSGSQIRQLMIQAGAQESMLASVSDEQLKTIFISQLESKLGSQQ